MSELGHDDTMVSPAFGTTHGLCHSHVLSVPLPGDDIVNQVPFPRVWVHPRCLVTGGKAEQCVGDDKVLGTTHLKEQKAVAIEVASCQLPVPFPGLKICPHSGIKIPENNNLL